MGYEEPNKRLLADKYRVSWSNLTEEQRRILCIRFGLQYTHASDEHLLVRVAEEQEALYKRGRAERIKRKIERIEKVEKSSCESAKQIR